jgi:predicted transcriptional regulator
MHHLLWYLLAGSRGGEMRARILTTLKERPRNANQLAKQLNVDYKTVQHHLNILLDNQVLLSKGKYGAVYFIAPEVEAHWKEFEEIWERIRQT